MFDPKEPIVAHSIVNPNQRDPSRYAVFPELFGGVPVSENPLMDYFFSPLDRESHLSLGLQKLRDHFVARHQQTEAMPHSAQKVAYLEQQVLLGKFIIDLSHGGHELLERLHSLDRAKRDEYSPYEKAGFIRALGGSKFLSIQKHLLDMAFAENTHIEVRQAATEALQGTTEPETILTLREELRAPLDARKLQACMALEGTKDTAALLDLIELASSAASNRFLVETAQNSVRGTSNGEVLDKLTRMLDHQEYPIRIGAARMLWETSHEATIDTLIGYLRGEKGSSMQQAAQVALSKNSTQYALNAIASLLESAPLSVAEAASELLSSNTSHRVSEVSRLAHLKLLKSTEPGRQLLGVKVLSHDTNAEEELALVELWVRADREVAFEIYRGFLKSFKLLSDPALKVLEGALQREDSALSEKDRGEMRHILGRVLIRAVSNPEVDLA